MLTYSDIIEHVSDYLGGSADAKGQTIVRRAIQQAYRELTQHPRGWRYFIRSGRVQLQAYDDTFTAAYTASTRALVSDGGAWPTWLQYGRVRIAGVNYDVDSVSGTTATLNSQNCPQANIATGTAVAIFQTEYPLPLDFIDIYIPGGTITNWLNCYVRPEDWFIMEKEFLSTGDPRYWTVAGGSNINIYGQRVLAVHPIPTSAVAYEYLYKRKARPLRLTGVAAANTQGTISISGTTVTGVGTAFTALMVGSVFRVSENSANLPTGLAGLEPYAEEFVVTAFSSSTSITISAAPIGSYSGVKYRVSDPVDIDITMEDAFTRLCELHCEIILNKTDSSLARSRNSYTMSLISAWEKDQTMGLDRAGFSFASGHNGGIQAYGLDYTVEFD